VKRGDVLKRNQDVAVQLDVGDVLDEAICGQHAVLVIAPEERDLDLLALVFVGVVLDGSERSDLGSTIYVAPAAGDPRPIRSSPPDHVLSGRAYKVLALQVELCSPRLVASRDDARWRPSGFRPGFWPQGQFSHSTPLSRLSRVARFQVGAGRRRATCCDAERADKTDEQTDLGQPDE
jgi:hypothetical protein